jgi:xanthine dehydrogenase YagS FAD-binding subunit
MTLGIDQVVSAAKAGAVVRAGGTDLGERLAHLPQPVSLIDLTEVTGLSGLRELPTGGIEIGALTTIASLATNPLVVGGYPALAAAASALATPQIRAIGTVGGNLLQHTRCSYYRHPAFVCYKKGGSQCPARDREHRHGVIFDTGVCVAPHASTLGAALLIYDAVAQLADGTQLTLPEIFGDGGDPRHNHLTPGQVLTQIVLPPAAPHELGAYTRATSRAFAEWPLVEAVARLVVERGVITDAGVSVGGVAPVPLRLSAVERHLIDQAPTSESFAKAAALAIEGSAPLPQTHYKVDLLPATVLEVLELALPSSITGPKFGPKFGETPAAGTPS